MNRIGICLWLALVVTAWPATRTRTTANPTNEVWRAGMTTNFHELFRSVIETTTPSLPFRSSSVGDSYSDITTPNPTNRTQWVARNLRSLESFRHMKWPVLEGWERIQFQRSGSSPSRTNAVSTAWLIEASPRGLRMLDASGTQVNIMPTNFIAHWQPIGFLEELRTTVAYLNRTNSDQREAPFHHLAFYSPTGPTLVRLAYEAAWFGHTNEALAVLRNLVRKDNTGLSFERMVLSAASAGYDEGVTLTTSEAARSEALDHWEWFARAFPQSPQHAVASDYVATLRQQVGEFAVMQRTAVENPERLPPAERAEYFLARFPDQTGLGRNNSYSFSRSEPDARARVEKLGLEAVPALLKHLTDRRLTRLASGDYGPSRHVLRVQDLALECLERITKVRFAQRRTREVFSTDKPESRDATVREINEWWVKHREQPLIQGQLALLEKMPLSERIFALQQLAQENPNEVKALDLLRKWAADAPADQRHLLAEPLARRGDLSLLPALRAALQKETFSSRQDVLLRYGGAEDYDAVRRYQWQRIAASRERNTYATRGLDHFLFQLTHTPGRDMATNFLAVPLLVDSAEHFRVSFHADSYGKVRPISRSDEVMGHLARLTGHAGDYRTNTPLAERAEALSRWLDWWEKTGRAEFSAAMPEVAPLFFEKPITADSLESRDPTSSVGVASANRALPVTYEFPRARLGELLKSGAVRGQQFGAVEVFRFATAATEEKWFAQTASQWLRAATGKSPTNTPPRPVTMHVAHPRGAWPDSEGKVWALCHNDSTWPAIFDGKRWRALSETNLPDVSRGFPSLQSAVPGERGAMFFRDDIDGTYLWDKAGWTPSLKLRSLSLEQTARLIQSTASSPAWSDVPGPQLVKDTHGNLWSVGAQSGVTFIGAKGPQHLDWPERSLSTISSAGQPWLLPLDKGRSVLAVSRYRGIAATFSAIDGIPRKVTDVPLPVPGHALLGATKDRSGQWWLTTATNSLAFDATGTIIANVPGQFLLEDQDKGRWFRDRVDSFRSTVRYVARDKSELSLALPQASSEIALAPDGTLWMLTTANRLVRLGVRKKALVVLEEWRVPTSGSKDRLWCDAAGRVWVRTGDTAFGSTSLTCIPAASRAD